MGKGLRPYLAFWMTCVTCLWLVRNCLVRAEDHVDYKYEVYAEESDRMLIRTHSALFEKDLAAWLSVKGELVYDGISGASPTGAPPPAGSSQVPTAHLEDIRRAVSVDSSLQFGPSTTTPRFSYSLENDYESYGVALNQSFDLNQKNTTLTLGVSHDFDKVMPRYWRGRHENKDTTDVFLGLTQVLSRHSLLSGAFTYGSAWGYLSDPYKGVWFEGYPYALFPDQRPEHRARQVALVSWTQYLPFIDGSSELSYRFSHDSFGIYSHTVALSWYLNLGKHVVVSPLFRYYQQTAASFYGTSFAGDPLDPESFPDVVIPEFYSADYRLASLNSFTYGVGITVKATKHLVFDFAYKRYEMHGLDSVTPDSNFAPANVFTAGVRLWF